MKGHGGLLARPWMLTAGVITLIAGHIVLFHRLSHTSLSAVVMAGVIVLIMIKHLGLLGPVYAFFRRRYRH
jgi:uncharacterized membrane protein HdeD (DUF308 family)